MGVTDPSTPLTENTHIDGAPAAEAGTSTSEFKLVIAALTTDVIGTGAAFGLIHMTDAQKVSVLTLEGTLFTAAVLVYTIVRNWRKKGTLG